MSKYIETKSIRIRTKLTYGFGYNDADYVVKKIINGKTVTCPYFSIWANMLKRCYCVKGHKLQPTYKKCTVSKKWLLFSNFREWMKSQDWENKQIDKDIMFPENSVYSDHTCVFVSREVNLLLGNNKASRGKYPQGVYLWKQTGEFRVKCSVNGKTKEIGRFNTVKEASKKYIEFKSNHIIEIANKQEDIRVKNGLLLHAELMR